jgi:hypothetical protein
MFTVALGAQRYWVLDEAVLFGDNSLDSMSPVGERLAPSYLLSRYHGLAPRRGRRRARKALGHPMLAADWHIPDVEGIAYAGLGTHWVVRPTDPARRQLAELRHLGRDLDTCPDGTFTPAIPAA